MRRKIPEILTAKEQEDPQHNRTRDTLPDTVTGDASVDARCLLETA